MNYIDKTNYNPHIYLYAKKLAHAVEEKVDLKKVQSLTKTRMFDTLLSQTSKIQNMKFDGLEENLKKAKKQTEEEKKALNYENIDEELEKLNVQCDDEEADAKIIDERQLNVYKLAKILYDEGNYERSLQIMKKLERQSLNDSLYLETTWARMYLEIVLGTTEAKKTAQRLKDKIDELEEDDEEKRKKVKNMFMKKNQVIKKQYAQKEQYLNLLPFIFFNKATDEDFQKFLDICTNKAYFSVVQLVSPHLFTYMCASMILNRTLQKNRPFDLFMLVETLKRKVIKHQDAFSEFLSALYIDYNFELAEKNIKKVEQQAKNDPLLVQFSQQLIQNCHFLYYKVYCKMFERIPLQRIANSLGKSVNQAELWILKLIRSLDVEAKIDSVEKVLISTREEQGINEKYIDIIPKMSAFINNLKQVKGK